ncbi:hypothetical protein Peur_004162 [Populus x canadensis]
MNYPVSVLYEISPSQQAVDLQFFWGIDVNPWQMLLPLPSPEYCSDLFTNLILVATICQTNKENCGTECIDDLIAV